MLCWPYPCRSLPSSGPLGTYKDSPALGVATTKGNSQYSHMPGGPGLVYIPRLSSPFPSAEKQGSFFSLLSLEAL